MYITKHRVLKSGHQKNNLIVRSPSTPGNPRQELLKTVYRLTGKDTPVNFALMLTINIVNTPVKAEIKRVLKNLPLL